MSNNIDKQQQLQDQQQQYQPRQQYSSALPVMNTYSGRSQAPQYNNSQFPTNVNNLYYGNQTYNNQMSMTEPTSYYHQQHFQQQQQFHQPQAQVQAQAQPQLFNPYSQPPQHQLQHQLQQQQQQQQQQHQVFNPYQAVQPNVTQPVLQQFNGEVIPTEPDEFIIDLLKKPQERLFLLKIELELEAFIKDKKLFRYDFPSMNSYQRLMIHRLAPYFKLNHYHDAMRKAVYVCKTFITESPVVSLSDVQLEDNTENDNTNSNNPLTNNNIVNGSRQFKIMRRDNGSGSPSPRSSTNNMSLYSEEEQAKIDRKNMTYEERKSAYEEARARIFQNAETEKS